MQLELKIFNRGELIRISKLIGIKSDESMREHWSNDYFQNQINEKINPEGRDLKEIYKEALDLYKIKYKKNISEANLRRKLYEYSQQKLTEAIGKLSEKKKKLLTDQLENCLDGTVLDVLKKKGKMGAKVGGGILLLQGGAIAITGSNLGICILLTTGLSSISGILGITFPFAVYTSAAIAGGWIIQAGHFIISPWTAIPLIGMSGFLIYRKARNKKYINLAGVNYLIESKKELGI